MDTNIYIQSTVGVCSEFMDKGKMREASVVVSPLKITQGDNIIRVTSGCNLWQACQNRDCHFSLVARPPKKVSK